MSGLVAFLIVRRRNCRPFAFKVAWQSGLNETVVEGGGGLMVS